MAPSLDVSIIFPVILALSLTLLVLYSHVEPYMDEIFHIPQAQHYCAGRFDAWNKGITTYPGLYWVSFLLNKTIGILLPSAKEHICSVQMLRSVNVLLSSILPIALYKCRKLIAPAASDAWAVALIVFIYPLNFFFYFVYYTDTLSTTTLVVTYYYSLKLNSTSTHPTMFQRLVLLLLAGSCIMARQTNAVWLLFLAGTSMLHHLIHGGFHDDELSFARFFSFVSYLWHNKGTLLSLTWPLLLPVVCFVGFVVKTGSIVLGDKENHQPVLHFAMLSHSLFLLSAVVAPLALCDVLIPPPTTAETKIHPKFRYVRALKTVLFYVSLAGLVGYMLVSKSYSHPFLESDNRHYMFYLWKRYLSSPSYRLVLSPVYALGACATLYRLRLRRGPVWVVIFLVALVVTLVPTPLLEPRYFTPGVVVALLNAPNMDLSRGVVKLSVLVVVAAMILVNVATVYVFLYKPFVWGDGTVARFMY